MNRLETLYRREEELREELKDLRFDGLFGFASQETVAMKSEHVEEELEIVQGWIIEEEERCTS